MQHQMPGPLRVEWNYARANMTEQFYGSRNRVHLLIQSYSFNWQVGVLSNQITSKINRTLPINRTEGLILMRRPQKFWLTNAPKISQETATQATGNKRTIRLCSSRQRPQLTSRKAAEIRLNKRWCCSIQWSKWHNFTLATRMVQRSQQNRASWAAYRQFPPVTTSDYYCYSIMYILPRIVLSMSIWGFYEFFEDSPSYQQIRASTTKMPVIINRFLSMLSACWPLVWGWGNPWAWPPWNALNP